MKELENHLQLVGQMIEDENFNIHSFLQRIKKKSQGFTQFPHNLLQKKGHRIDYQISPAKENDHKKRN